VRVAPEARTARVALGRPLRRAFYDRASPTVARDLLGRVLVHRSSLGVIAGRIVETEAYGGARDAASHAARGRTPRNASMFARPGTLYVYFTYGMHHCANLVTGPSGRASAVLIRALEPLAGIDLMRRFRDSKHRTVPRVELARGPGNVARALNLTLEDDGVDLTRGVVWVSDRPRVRRGRGVAAGPRIGLRRAVSRPWRFHLRGDPCVSAGPRLQVRR
jgi:DNA-3-methyladenine glycosylase